VVKPPPHALPPLKTSDTQTLIPFLVSLLKRSAIALSRHWFDGAS
jgi:hypothetical protein